MPVTIDPWTHVYSTTMVVMATTINHSNTYIVCFLTMVVYVTITLKKLYTIGMVAIVTI